MLCRSASLCVLLIEAIACLTHTHIMSSHFADVYTTISDYCHCRRRCCRRTCDVADMACVVPLPPSPCTNVTKRQAKRSLHDAMCVVRNLIRVSAGYYSTQHTVVAIYPSAVGVLYTTHFWPIDMLVAVRPICMPAASGVAQYTRCCSHAAAINASYNCYEWIMCNQQGCLYVFMQH